MSASQDAVLRALGRRSMSTVSIASVVDARVVSVQRTLDALFRKSLVTISPSGKWSATERGRRKVKG